ncbi:MAG: FitA-like ribbon-helix-helix domain-containing protein [Gemmatimonadaceae bacterium]
MAKMIQVRSVPDKLHRELVRRARKRGQTLTQYVQQILEREVSRPLVEDVFERIARFPRLEVDRPAAERIREARAERSAHLERVLRGTRGQ